MHVPLAIHIYVDTDRVILSAMLTRLNLHSIVSCSGTDAREVNFGEVIDKSVSSCLSGGVDIIFLLFDYKVYTYMFVRAKSKHMIIFLS